MLSADGRRVVSNAAADLVPIDARRLVAYVDGLTLQALFAGTAPDREELERQLRWFVDQVTLL